MARSKTYKKRGGKRGPNNNLTPAAKPAELQAYPILNNLSTPRYAPATAIPTIEFLDKSDIELLNDTNLISLPDKILEKLHNAQLILSKESWIIPTGRYNDVYVTSDIHADLRKFIQLLLGLGLIIYPNLPNAIYNILTIDPIPIEYITDMEWSRLNPTILVIVGDLIDGRRAQDYYVFDNKGNIELLLHAFLYNLRIKALQKYSEIRFTVGNHDNISLLSKYTTETLKFISNYTHSNALSFFRNIYYRRDCLLPFYKCCPYFIVSIGNEAIFVHGGIHSSIPIYEVIRLQESIQENISNYEIVQQAMQDPNSPLWVRYYSENSSELACNALKQNNFYKLTVVGHCVTGENFPHHSEIIQKYEKAGTNRCGGGGCVLIGCDENKIEGPHLAFVDIGMSRAFGDNTTKLAEILLLHHNVTLDTSVRYYNVLFRVQANINTGDITPYLQWASPLIRGGNKRTTRKYRKKI